ncbi:MAG: SGNH/GDSL hydrolase family protein [Clostridiales bacterium]|nr:SGNH/GDSL hydrolase family protein [Clostridiales bacterium]
MKIVCIGDSLTEGDYGIPGKRGIANVQPENYPYFLSKILGADVINCGKCGYTATGYLKYYTAGNVDVAGSDIIIVMLGTNGGMSGKQETEGDRDYDTLIKRLMEDSRGAKVVICTAPRATVDASKPGFGNAERIADANDFIRRYAADNNIPLIDVNSVKEFTEENEPVMQPNDGLHFGRTGYQVMANFIADKLREMKLV